jgi:hypothetical protein
MPDKRELVFDVDAAAAGAAADFPWGKWSDQDSLSLYSSFSRIM